MQRRVLLIAAALLFALAGVATADIPPEQLAKAREAFARGQKLHQAGKYDEAIAAYRTAYESAPLPGLVFNLGQVHRLKGDKRKAVEYYKQYLTVAPGGEGAVEAQSHISVLGREIDAEDAAAREQSAASERERAVEDARQKEREAARVERERQAQADAAREARSSGKGLKIAGLATAGGGVALLGVGIVFGLKAKAKSNELADLGPGDEWDSSIRDDGKSANTMFIALTVAGGAAVATGGVLYFLGVRKDRERGVAVIPGPRGIVFAGTF